MAYDDLHSSQSRRDKQNGRTVGNIDPANPHFVGRFAEFAQLHQIVSRERQLAVITPVQGRAGLGATALAIHYAHVFANEYDGGCWLVQCRDRQDPVSAVSPELKLKFNGSHRCLLLLDNVDRPELLELDQIKRVLCGDARADWLDVIATSRAEETNPSAPSERVIVRLAELPEAGAVALIESFQPNRKFVREDDRVAALEIVKLLGGFTLAIEVAAAYLGNFASEVRFPLFYAFLLDAGLPVRHSDSESGKTLDQKRLIAALRSTVESLSESEGKILFRAASSGSEQIILPEFKSLIARELFDLSVDSAQTLPQALSTVVRRFVDLRLWRPTSAVDDNGEPLIVRMHPLLQESMLHIVRKAGLESAGFTVVERPPRDERRPIYSEEPGRLYGHSLRELYSEEVREVYSESRPRRAAAQMAGAVESSAPAAPKPLDDNVMFTVYRRKTVAPNKWYPLLAFAHLSEPRPDAPLDEPDPLAEVARQAEMVLGKSVAEYKQTTQDSTASIPRSGELTFKPYAEGVEFNPSSRSFRWEESVHREEFKMRAGAELDGQTTRGWLRVYLGPLIIAQVNLTFSVDSNAVTQPVRPDDTNSARAFRKIFASYSHKDKPIVEHIEKIVSESYLGLEYLRDATKLRSGEVWNDELMRMIDAADIFQLFWSTNSMSSKYVQQEYEYALSRSVPDFVRPVYWEKPFPERPDEGLPPEQLRCLHFEEMTIADPPRLKPPLLRYGTDVLTRSPGETIKTMRFERLAPEVGAPQSDRAKSVDRENLDLDEVEARSDTRYNWKPDDDLFDMSPPETTAVQSGDRAPVLYESAPPAGAPPAGAPPIARSAPTARSAPLAESAPMVRSASGDVTSRLTHRRRSPLKIIGVAAMVVPIVLVAPLLLMTMMSTGASTVAPSGGAPGLLLLLLGGGLLFVIGLALLIFQRNR
jgi:hypothetical protein